MESRGVSLLEWEKRENPQNVESVDGVWASVEKTLVEAVVKVLGTLGKQKGKQSAAIAVWSLKRCLTLTLQ